MMTISDKIVVLEAARDRLDDLLVERAEKIANATNAFEFSPGEFAKLFADAGAIGDHLYSMREADKQRRVDEAYERSVYRDMGKAAQ